MKRLITSMFFLTFSFLVFSQNYVYRYLEYLGSTEQSASQFCGQQLSGGLKYRITTTLSIVIGEIYKVETSSGTISYYYVVSSASNRDFDERISGSSTITLQDFCESEPTYKLHYLKYLGNTEAGASAYCDYPPIANSGIKAKIWTSEFLITGEIYKVETSGNIEYYLINSSSSGSTQDTDETIGSSAIITLQDFCNSVSPLPQMSNENYVLTIEPQAPVDFVINEAVPSIKSVQYFDGLGRPKQEIAMNAGGQAEDIISPIVYDDFGRIVQTYLPYAVTNTSNGQIYNNPLTELYSFYDVEKYENTPNPYSEKILEDSRLNRVLEQAAPGSDWSLDNNHTIKFGYQANITEDAVRRFDVGFIGGNTEAPQLIDNGVVYSSNKLYKSVIKDENWQSGQQYPKDHTTEEYKNKLEQVILKRTFNRGKQHDTYYVYDDFGNLTYVLPPKMATYLDFWQTDAPSQQIPVTSIDLLLSGYVLEYAWGNIYFNSITKQVLLYYNGFSWSNPNIEVTFKQGYAMDLPLGVDLPNITLTGSLSYTDTNGISQQLNVSATIQNNQLHLNSDFPTGTLTINNSFYLQLEANLGAFNISSPDLTLTDLNALAYQYKYDQRNRLIEKKIPGKAWEYIVYDKLNRPVLTRNPLNEEQWLFTKYDIFGRVVYTGICDYADDTRSAMQQLVDNSSTLHETRVSSPTTLSDGTTLYYTSDAFPDTNIIEVHTVSYYDDYTFDLAGGSSEDTYGITPTTNVQGLTTGTKSKVLETNDWITIVNYYDDKARPIYTYSNNTYLGAVDKVKHKLDFLGKVVESTTIHQKSGLNSITIVDKFEYDHVNRLVLHKQNINNALQDEVIVQNTYDELGQVVSKGVGGRENQQRLQNIDYSYNIRGWLKGINDPVTMHSENDLFSFGLNYNQPNGPSTSSMYNQPLYNGNISHAYWKTDNIDSELRHYSYRYDALNRFTSAYYAQSHNYNSKFTSYIDNYDRNGNIERMVRYAQSPTNSNSSTSMDNLTYTYDEGNKLLSVSDSNNNATANGLGGFVDGNTIGNDYIYDTHGNMISDFNKGITTIVYNHLNLPTSISINGTQGEGAITYIYDATGVKQSKEVWLSSTSSSKFTYYAGNYIYEQGHSMPLELKFFNHPEGYVEPNGTFGYDYIYQYRDHLGNIRLSYKDNNADGQITGGSTVIWSDGFESATGWDNSSSMSGWGWPLSAFDSSFKFRGNYSGRLDPYGNSNERATHSDDWIPISNTVDTDYIMSAWVYLENIGNNSAEMLLLMSTPEETGYATAWEFSGWVTSKGRWVYLEKRVTVPSNMSRINLRIDNNGDGRVWYDELVIRRANPDMAIEIVEEHNYYPFGLLHRGYNDVVSANVNSAASKFKYNGKELNDELGLDMYDYGARNYDPAIGRWWQIDPLAEQMRRFSPYNFAWNNPIYFIDPDGMFAEGFGDFFDKNGKKIGTDGIDDGKKYVVTDKKEVKSIKKTDKAGGTTQVSDVSSAQQLPSDAVLTESVNVLDRQIDNGGLKEEASIVMNDGTVVKAPTGTEPVIKDGVSTATTYLPSVPEGKSASDVEATIHSHPTKVQEVGDQVFPHSASVPSGADLTVFKNYDTNVIVGPIGTVKEGSVTRGPDGKVSVPKRSNGVVIYNRSGQQTVSLKKKVVQRIIQN
ncbi:DUF6443 domain-containing protein [Winogradskyella sp.]|uniref:DUF6443 domain-containing protein n=1 Tax=Winogradskyella sp. TaxID=1883156 RepID=UPI00262342AC|nr:DUF6443 domain-containing protein [Winogradskyella sp.]